VEYLNCRIFCFIMDRGESGQGLAEYALILALVALTCVTALTGLGNAIGPQLDAVTAGL
jgi:Flp pilus assembly pilin Flp